MNAVPAIDDLLRQVPSWTGRAVSWQRLGGGLSHHIYRIDVDDESYVLRVLEPSVSAAGLGIAPELEVVNTVRAASSGVGPAVHVLLPDIPALVLEYLPGRTLSAADVRDPTLAVPIATACRRLHAGPAFDNDFDILEKRVELLNICAGHDLPLPDGYLATESSVDRLRAALAADALPTVPCHNDLLAENLVEQQGSVRIIDYQLSGNNDPTFELGDIAAEADYDPDQVGRLAEAYFGLELTDALLARTQLNLIASNVTWTLWFAVHSGLLSNPDAGFDYELEAADKWSQARRDLDSTEFGRLLDRAAGRRTVAVTNHPAQTAIP